MSKKATNVEAEAAATAKDLCGLFDRMDNLERDSKELTIAIGDKLNAMKVLFTGVPKGFKKWKDANFRKYKNKMYFSRYMGAARLYAIIDAEKGNGPLLILNSYLTKSVLWLLGSRHCPRKAVDRILDLTQKRSVTEEEAAKIIRIETQKKTLARNTSGRKTSKADNNKNTDEDDEADESEDNATDDEAADDEPEETLEGKPFIDNFIDLSSPDNFARQSRWLQDIIAVDDDQDARYQSGREKGTAYSKTHSEFPALLMALILDRYDAITYSKKTKTYSYRDTSERYVLDPFAGAAQRGVMAVAKGYTYHGIDTNQKMIDQNYRVARDLLEPEAMERLKYFCGSSLTLNDLNGQPLEGLQPKYDICITCPPYYNMEVYSTLPEDVSTAKTFDEFLDMMWDLPRMLWDKMKPGAHICIVIGDLRYNQRSVKKKRDPKENEYLGLPGRLEYMFQKSGYLVLDRIRMKLNLGSTVIRAGSLKTGTKSVNVLQDMLVFQVPLNKQPWKNVIADVATPRHQRMTLGAHPDLDFSVPRSLVETVMRPVLYRSLAAQLEMDDGENAFRAERGLPPLATLPPLTHEGLSPGSQEDQEASEQALAELLRSEQERSDRFVKEVEEQWEEIKRQSAAKPQGKIDRKVLP